MEIFYHHTVVFSLSLIESFILGEQSSEPRKDKLNASSRDGLLLFFFFFFNHTTVEEFETRVFSWLQPATALQDATESYKLDLKVNHLVFNCPFKAFKQFQEPIWKNL